MHVILILRSAITIFPNGTSLLLVISLQISLTDNMYIFFLYTTPIIFILIIIFYHSSQRRNISVLFFLFFCFFKNFQWHSLISILPNEVIDITKTFSTSVRVRYFSSPPFLLNLTCFLPPSISILQYLQPSNPSPHPRLPRAPRQLISIIKPHLPQPNKLIYPLPNPSFLNSDHKDHRFTYFSQQSNTLL